MSSALEARAALSKLEGVVRVLAYGHNGKAVVVLSDKKSPSKERIEELLKPTSKGLKLRRIEKA